MRPFDIPSPIPEPIGQPGRLRLPATHLDGLGRDLHPLGRLAQPIPHEVALHVPVPAAQAQPQLPRLRAVPLAHVLIPVHPTELRKHIPPQHVHMIQPVPGNPALAFVRIPTPHRRHPPLAHEPNRKSRPQPPPDVPHRAPHHRGSRHPPQPIPQRALTLPLPAGRRRSVERARPCPPRPVILRCFGRLAPETISRPVRHSAVAQVR